ncbi:MAG: methyltransferase domain-containing protein [Bacteroidetes bacterium]|nr:methyltransferase domain-containing protein [Bacteroidota bacterium]
MNILKYIKNKKYSFIFIGMILVFISGFRLAINLRYETQKELIPERALDQYLSKFDPKNYKHPYLELLKRYIVSTEEEYSRYKMEILFNLVTKSWMEWFIEYEPKNSKILDIGGATGIQWTFFKKAYDKNFKVSLIEVDRNSIEIGKKNYQNKNLKFYHISETQKINKNIDTILLCGVYMQISNSAQVLKDYLSRFPNSKAVVIHTCFNSSTPTKFLNFLKQKVIKFIPVLNLLQGRAMTDEEFYLEMENANLKIIEEFDLSNISKNDVHFNAKIKAYIIKNKQDIFSFPNKV